MLHQKMPGAFFARDTHLVARALLGKLLVRRWRGRDIIGRISEVECYIGENDAACHASRGQTKRNAMMYGRAGHAYVYLIYGLHHCLNVVTEPAGFPAAVLIRALVPVTGIASRQRGQRPSNPAKLTAGPGKLTKALHISRSHNGTDLVSSLVLYIADDGFRMRSSNIVAAPRIGIEYAGAAAKLPWRYYISSPLPVNP